MSVTHSKVSAVADGDDTTLVRPSDWNAAHLGTNDHYHGSTSGDGGFIGNVGWTKQLDASPMSSLTGWTTRSGVWTAGGTYGVQQTATGTQDCWLHSTLTVSTGFRAIQATVRVVSTTSSGWAGFGFGVDGTWANTSLSIGLRPTFNVIAWDKYGTGGGTTAFTSAYDTDYVFQVMESTRQAAYDVFVNGAFVTTISTSAIATARVGLYTRFSNAWFRNVTIWTKQPSPLT